MYFNALSSKALSIVILISLGISILSPSLSFAIEGALGGSAGGYNADGTSAGYSGYGGDSSAGGGSVGGGYSGNGGQDSPSEGHGSAGPGGGANSGGGFGGGDGQSGGYSGLGGYDSPSEGYGSAGPGGGANSGGGFGTSIGGAPGLSPADFSSMFNGITVVMGVNGYYGAHSFDNSSAALANAHIGIPGVATAPATLANGFTIDVFSAAGLSIAPIGTTGHSNVTNAQGNVVGYMNPAGEVMAIGVDVFAPQENHMAALGITTQPTATAPTQSQTAYAEPDPGRFGYDVPGGSPTSPSNPSSGAPSGAPSSPSNSSPGVASAVPTSPTHGVSNASNPSGVSIVGGDGQSGGGAYWQQAHQSATASYNQLRSQTVIEAASSDSLFSSGARWIQNAFARFGMSNPAYATFTMDDVISITSVYVDPDSRVADDEYYVYTVTLKTGEVRKVTLPAFAPVAQNYQRLQAIGFSGNAVDFLTAAKQVSNEFGIDTVKTITVASLDPNTTTTYDNYQEYALSLNDGRNFIVHTHAAMSESQIADRFKQTGYTGDVSTLIAKATSTGTIGDTGFFNKIKNLATGTYQNLLSLFIGKTATEFTELPRLKEPDSWFTDTVIGRNALSATPTSGSSPLSVTFTIASAFATLNFGDGTVMTQTCTGSPSNPTPSSTNTSHFERDEIVQMLKSEVTLADGTEQILYKIKLSDGSVRTIRIDDSLTYRQKAAKFAEIGYTGSVLYIERRAHLTTAEEIGYITDDKNPNGVCGHPTAVVHTYQSDGTYTAQLVTGLSSNDVRGKIVGSRTITVGNKTGTSTTNGLSASPASGPAPLTVTFSSTHGDMLQYRPSTTDGSDTMLDFGDGSTRAWLQCPEARSSTSSIAVAVAVLGKKTCGKPATITHTYEKNGVYTAKVLRVGSGFSPATDGRLTRVPTESILTTLSITVGSTTQSSVLQATPTSGSAPLTVTFTTMTGDGESERPSHSDGNDTMLYFGDESSPTWLQCPTKDGRIYARGSSLEYDCSVSKTYTHIYKNPGTYIAKIVKEGGRCSSGSCPAIEVATKTIVVGTSTDANSINLEAKVVRHNGTTKTDWTKGQIALDWSDKLYLRWNATGYSQCIPFFGDNGLYALSRQGDIRMLTGNTETEKYDLREYSGTYSVQCGNSSDANDVDVASITASITTGASGAPQGQGGYSQTYVETYHPGTNR